VAACVTVINFSQAPFTSFFQQCNCCKVCGAESPDLALILGIKLFWRFSNSVKFKFSLVPECFSVKSLNQLVAEPLHLFGYTTKHVYSVVKRLSSPQDVRTCPIWVTRQLVRWWRGVGGASRSIPTWPGLLKCSNIHDPLRSAWICQCGRWFWKLDLQSWMGRLGATASATCSALNNLKAGVGFQLSLLEDSLSDFILNS
jgi:hypothetical protein